MEGADGDMLEAIGGGNGGYRGVLDGGGAALPAAAPAAGNGRGAAAAKLVKRAVTMTAMAIQR